MKRDMDLIRALLLRLESLDIPSGVLVSMYPGADETAVEGYSGDAIAHHLRMLIDAGFLVVHGSGFSASGEFLFRAVSWDGHDFLDSVRDPKIWERTKEGVAGAGGFTVDLLKDLAKGFVKKQIEEYTGVKL